MSLMGMTENGWEQLFHGTIFPLWGHYQKIIKSNKGQLLTSCSHTFFGKQVRTYLGLKAVHLFPPKDLLSSYYVPNSGHILLKATVPLCDTWNLGGCGTSYMQSLQGTFLIQVLSLLICCHPSTDVDPPPTQATYTHMGRHTHAGCVLCATLFYSPNFKSHLHGEVCF